MANPPASAANGGAPTVRLSIPAKAEYITLVRLALSGISQSRELSDEALGDWGFAADEIAKLRDVGAIA